MKKKLIFVICALLYLFSSSAFAYNFTQSNAQMLKQMKKWSANDWRDNMHQLVSENRDNKTLVKKVLTIASKAMNSSNVLTGSEIYHIVAQITGDVIGERIYSITSNRSGYTISLNEDVYATESMDIASAVPETTTPASTVPETTVPETTVPETTVPETTVPESSVDVVVPTVSDDSTATGN